MDRHAELPLKLKDEDLYKQVDQRRIRNDQGRMVKPENVVDEQFKTLFEVKKAIPQIKLPAVWLPHGVLGISNSEILPIPENTFGPFAGQILVGDQGQSKIMRVVMEKVKGEYQGVAFDFRAASSLACCAWPGERRFPVRRRNQPRLGFRR